MFPDVTIPAKFCVPQVIIPELPLVLVKRKLDPFEVESFLMDDKFKSAENVTIPTELLIAKTSSAV